MCHILETWRYLNCVCFFKKSIPFYQGVGVWVMKSKTIIICSSSCLTLYWRGRRWKSWGRRTEICGCCTHLCKWWRSWKASDSSYMSRNYLFDMWYFHQSSEGVTVTWSMYKQWGTGGETKGYNKALVGWTGCQRNSIYYEALMGWTGWKLINNETLMVANKVRALEPVIWVSENEALVGWTGR